MDFTEAWKEGYATFLKEEEERYNNDFLNTMDEVISLSEESKKSLDLLQEYYDAFAESEGLTEAIAPVGSSASAQVGEKKSGLGQTIANLLGQFGDSKLSTYSPSAVYTYQKISDMKFPGNIVFFITQIISWIRNVVIYLFEKFKNLIRRMLGEKPNILNPAALKLELKKARQIEQVARGIDLGKSSSDIVKA